jgi:hypothetical protein
LRALPVPFILSLSFRFCFKRTFSNRVTATAFSTDFLSSVASITFCFYLNFFSVASGRSDSNAFSLPPILLIMIFLRLFSCSSRLKILRNMMGFSACSFCVRLIAYFVRMLVRPLESSHTRPRTTTPPKLHSLWWRGFTICSLLSVCRRPKTTEKKEKRQIDFQFCDCCSPSRIALESCCSRVTLRSLGKVHSHLQCESSRRAVERQFNCRSN